MEAHRGTREGRKEAGGSKELKIKWLINQRSNGCTDERKMPWYVKYIKTERDGERDFYPLLKIVKILNHMKND